MSNQPSTPAKETPLPPDTLSEGANGSKSGTPSRSKSRLSIAGLKRSASNVLQSQEGQAGKKALKAYGRTLVGMSPIWLMGEALTGRKVGTQFKKGTSELVGAAEELLDILGDSAKDVLVIVDQKLRTQTEETKKTGDVLRSAGENAIVVVTSSLLESKSQFEKNAPGLKHTVLKNSKDVVIILDKAVKHPIVITGVTKFAKSKGIPRPEAILTVAALGLGKLVKILDEAEAEARQEIAKLEAEAAAAHQAHASTSDAAEGDLIVIDAADFEKTVPSAESKKADEIGKSAAPPPGSDAPSAPGAFPSTSTADKGKKKKDDGCIIF